MGARDIKWDDPPDRGGSSKEMTTCPTCNGMVRLALLTEPYWKPCPDCVDGTANRLPLSVREVLRVARHYAVARHGTPLALIDEAERWIRAGTYPNDGFAP